jgi:hypothetical protein
MSAQALTPMKPAQFMLLASPDQSRYLAGLLDGMRHASYYSVGFVSPGLESEPRSVDISVLAALMQSLSLVTQEDDSTRLTDLVDRALGELCDGI